MKRHNSFGKTEMWYVINATSDAYLYSGFSSRITPDEYVETVANNTFTDKLQKYEVKPGDVFFLPAGRVHAIGAGCFIAEIQQTSNITYRIYDYNRKDAEGNTRNCTLNWQRMPSTTVFSMITGPNTRQLRTSRYNWHHVNISRLPCWR
jgi:mannose-6-phosphate isomerase class I